MRRALPFPNPRPGRSTSRRRRSTRTPPRHRPPSWQEKRVLPRAPRARESVGSHGRKPGFAPEPAGPETRGRARSPRQGRDRLFGAATVRGVRSWPPGLRGSILSTSLAGARGSSGPPGLAPSARHGDLRIMDRPSERDTAPHRHPRVRDDVVFRRVGEDWIVFDPVTQRIHVLNLSAAPGACPSITVGRATHALRARVPRAYAAQRRNERGPHATYVAWGQGNES